MDKRKSGFFAEDYAEKLLKAKSYRIVERNFYTRNSEIDIIAIKDNTLVFVEVKARWGVKFGKPEESINSKKLLKIKRAGELFIKKHPNLPKKQRIDVVSLLYDHDEVVSEKIIRVY